MSNGSTRQEAEESFSHHRNDEAGPGASTPLSGHLIFNNSDDLYQMSKKLHDYYDNFNEPNYIIVGIYIPTIVIALIANVLVIVIVLKNQYLRSVTNYFIVNLSVSDLLVATVCMPTGISQAVSITWAYGETMCKLIFYLQGVAVMASIFTMTAMSIDRYLAISKPVSLNRVFSRRTTIIIIVAIWLGPLIIFSPVLAAVTLTSFRWNNITLAIRRDGIDEIVDVFQPPTLEFCTEEFGSLGMSAAVYGASCFALVYVIPGFIVIVAYARMGRSLCSRRPPFDSDSTRQSACSQQGFRLLRERKRVAWILLVMAILFALCWLPYNVLRLLVDFGMVDNSKGIADGLSYCLFLGHANSALNPVVYCLMTRNFRRNVYKILCGCYSTSRPKPDRKITEADSGARIVFSKVVQYRSLFKKKLLQGSHSKATKPRRTRQSRETKRSGCDHSCILRSPHRYCCMLKFTVQMKNCRHKNVITLAKKRRSGMNEDQAAKSNGHAPNRIWKVQKTSNCRRSGTTPNNRENGAYVISTIYNRITEIILIYYRLYVSKMKSSWETNCIDAFRIFVSKNIRNTV